MRARGLEAKADWAEASLRSCWANQGNGARMRAHVSPKDEPHMWSLLLVEFKAFGIQERKDCGVIGGEVRHVIVGSK